ncbi:MAG: osmoprotectant transport system ATP-binding protein [Planctomycetota bacterium]|jgi:osmoprotectant transport system ATP-binding protein
MIRFEHVFKSFPGSQGTTAVQALHDLSLEVERGEAFCLIGSSGCGKTTSLRMINQLDQPDSGRVLFDGDDVAKLDPVSLRRKIGYVIQRGGLFPHMTVADNIGLLCELEGWDAKRRRQRIDELLSLVQLEPTSYRSRYPNELSGGQRGRVGVARALALDPQVLLLDEPFGALDPITRDELQQEFKTLQRELHKTIVMVSHDLEEAFLIADRVGLMDAGRLLQVGTLDDFKRNPSTEFVQRFLERHTREH